MPANLYQKDFIQTDQIINNQKFPKGYLFDLDYEKQKEVGDYYADLIKRHILSGNKWFYLVFNSSSFDLVVKNHPDKVSQWVKALCKNSNKLFHGRSFAVALCKELLVLGESEGINLYKTLYNANQGVNMIYSQWLKINDYDTALLKGEINQQLEVVIKERFTFCRSDQEIMSLSVGFQLFRNDNWLQEYAGKLVKSEISYDVALGLTILGFHESLEAKSRLTEYIDNQEENTWLKKVAEKSYSTWEVNAWAKHWFDRFIQEQSNVDAWASFRLYLKCVDFRFILWRQEKFSDLENKDWVQERIAFFKINHNQIDQSRDKNTK